jgi:23S rRNA pseudouridine1911/1915/1917 synthase
MQLRDVLTKFSRQALHATRLALEHPVTGEMMEWHVPMPDDMLQLLKNIRSALDEPESD